jgi:hypothetical protein
MSQVARSLTGLLVPTLPLALAAGVAALAVSLVLGDARVAMANSGHSYSIEQDGATWAVQPIQGAESVISFYDYNANGLLGPNTGYERVDTSRLFLFRDDNGEISIVFLHDSPGDSTGGFANFAFAGLPAIAAWAVQDDSSDIYTGTPPSAAEWAWANNPRADGGAIEGGLNGEFEVTITPTLFSGITDWEFLSGNGHQLDLTKPVTIRSVAEPQPPAPEPAYSIEQDGSTWAVEPIAGAESVISFYDYNAGGLVGPNTGLEVADASRLFLYRDHNDEISIVFLHDSTSDATGGAANFALSGLPLTATWAVQDDASDIYTGSPPSAAGWAWADNPRADGGAIQGGLNGAFEVTITPTFLSGISSWDFISGGGHPLDLTKPVTIRATVDQSEPPTADAGGPYSVGEGGAVEVTASGSDPEGGPVTYAWDLDHDGVFETAGQTVSFSAAGLDGPSAQPIAVEVTDGDGLTATAEATVNVVNVGPSVDEIMVSATVVGVGTELQANADFADPGVPDTHTAIWDWGDTTSSAAVISGLNAAGSHTYTTPGVYTVRATVTDDDGDSGESIFQFVVAFDPNAGFATGGGWIVPGGASSDVGDVLPGIDGASKATFGFVVKYKNGATTTPVGNLQFQYHVGQFQLKSVEYEWLVVTNTNIASFKGHATINGSDELYPFKVEARDGKHGTADRFTIKIWDAGADSSVDELIYKASGNLGGGSITIHQ